nr:hypothetical protein [Rhodoferax sp.]
MKNLWTLSLERSVLHRGAVAWADLGAALPARLKLAQVELQAGGLHWPSGPSIAQFEGSASLQASATDADWKPRAELEETQR